MSEFWFSLNCLHIFLIVIIYSCHLQEYGLVVVGEEENGEADIPVKDEDDEFADMDDLTPRKIAVKKALLSQEAADLLSKGAAQDSLGMGGFCIVSFLFCFHLFPLSF